MSYPLPHRLLGTSRIDLEGRADFGALLDAIAAEGRGTLLTEGSSWVWQVLRAGGRLQRWDVCALVPHVAGYIREATDYGMLGAGWRRLRRMSPLSWLRLGIVGVGRFRGVLRKDFPTLLVLLLELEMANFRRVRPPVMFLHPQITDLLVAMDHGLALETAVRRIRRGFGAEPGLATYNAGTLLPRLEQWGVEVPYLLTALHPRGHGMRPSRDDCEQALKRFKGQVVTSLDGELTEDIAAYWRDRRVASAVYDVCAPQVDAWCGTWAVWQNRVARAAEAVLV
jgi:hypothetical protein